MPDSESCVYHDLYVVKEEGSDIQINVGDKFYVYSYCQYNDEMKYETTVQSEQNGRYYLGKFEVLYGYSIVASKNNLDVDYDEYCSLMDGKVDIKDTVFASNGNIYAHLPWPWSGDATLVKAPERPSGSVNKVFYNGSPVSRVSHNGGNPRVVYNGQTLYEAGASALHVECPVSYTNGSSTTGTTKPIVYLNGEKITDLSDGKTSFGIDYFPGDVIRVSLDGINPCDEFFFMINGKQVGAERFPAMRTTGDIILPSDLQSISFTYVYEFMCS